MGSRGLSFTAQSRLGILRHRIPCLSPKTEDYDMPSPAPDRTYWLARAAQARMHVHAVSDPEERLLLNRIAELYDKLAANARGPAVADVGT
jgi:hypothetical protein